MKFNKRLVNNYNNITIFIQGKPVSKSYHQGVPWTTKIKIKIKLKVLKTLQNDLRNDIYNNKKI